MYFKIKNWVLSFYFKHAKKYEFLVCHFPGREKVGMILKLPYSVDAPCYLIAFLSVLRFSLGTSPDGYKISIRRI